MSSAMFVDQFGNKFWENKNGLLNREDGPAIEDLDGYKGWWIDGFRHRIEGPAQEWPSGTKGWWVGGKNITSLVFELLRKSPFGGDVHLGILAEYFAERNDFRLLEIVSPHLEQL